MEKTKITLRQKEILKKVCGEYKFVTISSIAEKLDISSRTVLRELGDIDAWLKPYGSSLEKKAGLGIRLKGSLEDRKKILDSLEENKELKGYSPKERQVILLGELLQEKEPVKLFSFAKLLNVTEGTVSHDLDKIEEWLKNYNLVLIRKPGLGVYIEGQEDEIRKAIVNLIYENINETELLNLIRDNLSVEVNTRERLLNLIEKDTIKQLEALIFELEEAFCFRLADNAYIGLLVHLALAIQRIKKNDRITMDSVYLEELKSYDEFKAAAELTKKISKVFNLEIPEEETGYITMHLRGSKGLKDNKVNSELEALAREMIEIAETETGRVIGYNEQSLVGIINHLAPAINRLKMKMGIRNPLLEEIKEHYADLYSLAIKCARPVERYLGINMPDSEIAYIAMHLGAALERSNTSVRRVYNAAVVCTTGIGTSRLLAAKIEKEYGSIRIVDVISSLHIKENTLVDNGVDFIISTIPLDLKLLPLAIVNPLLFKKDKERIEDLLKQLNNKPNVYKEQKSEITDLKEKFSKLNLYTEGILQILNNFFLYEYEQLNSIIEVIEEVGRSISEESGSTSQIHKDLIKREEKGSTVLTGFNTILLHCRTSGVKEMHFGAVRVKNGLFALNAENELEEINLAIIMLVPEQCNNLHLEIIGFISSKLIDAPEFLEYLTIGSENDVYSKVNKFLEEFYMIKNS